MTRWTVWSGLGGWVMGKKMRVEMIPAARSEIHSLCQTTS